MTNVNITVNGFVGDEKQLAEKLGEVIREALDDISGFKEFFERMGHTIEVKPISVDGEKYLHGDMPEETEQAFLLSQAIFCFDKNGTYLGVVADEMGFFIPSEKPSGPIVTFNDDEDYSDIDQEDE